MCERLCDTQRNNDYQIFNDFTLNDCHYDATSKYDENKVVLIYERAMSDVAGRSQEEADGDVENAMGNKRFVLKSNKRYFLSFDVIDLKKRTIVEQLTFLLRHIQVTLLDKFGVRIDDAAARVWLSQYAKRPEAALATMLNSDEQIGRGGGGRRRRRRDLLYYVRLLSTDADTFVHALSARDKRALATFIANLVLLMSQDEYLFHRYFGAKPGVLATYGTCGHFYAVEYAKPLDQAVHRMSTDERKRLARQFLQLVRGMDTLYLLDDNDERQRSATAAAAAAAVAVAVGLNGSSKPVQSMQMCNFKLANFGLNEHGQLVLVDTAKIHSDYHLFANGDTRVCIDDESCHYYDCKSACVPSTGATGTGLEAAATKHCAKRRLNNNLQSLCAKIFLNNGEDDLTLFDSNEPRGELPRHLQACKDTPRDNNTQLPGATSDTYFELLDALLAEDATVLIKP